VPGTASLRRPLNSKGTAILKEGQYTDVYSIDLHQGKYEALCQRNGNVEVYRDGDKDDTPELTGKTFKGMFGINIHKAGSDSKIVEN
jgi:hypothetical protein